MKTILDRLFRRERAEPIAPTASISSELSASDIENYYLRVIADVLRRMLVPSEHIDITVMRSGTGAGRLPAFAGYVRILRWDAVMTPVLLQNIPVIDARIRKVAAASVILEHTHFSGVWFQATSSTAGAPTTLVGLPAELVLQPGGPSSNA